MTTPTTKQRKIGPIFYWQFHKGAQCNSHFEPADLKSNLTLSFQRALCSQKQGLILATKSLMFNILFFSLSLSNLQPGVNRSRHGSITKGIQTQGIRLLLKTNVKSGVQYVPASVNFLCCVVIIADVSTQAVGGIK